MLASMARLLVILTLFLALCGLPSFCSSASEASEPADSDTSIPGSDPAGEQLVDWIVRRGGAVRALK